MKVMERLKKANNGFSIPDVFGEKISDVNWCWKVLLGYLQVVFVWNWRFQWERELRKTSHNALFVYGEEQELGQLSVTQSETDLVWN